MEAFWLRVLLASLLAPSAVLSQGDVPSVDDFMRRGSSRISVIGDYIYFEGGELSQAGLDFRMNDPANSTLSINLARSWQSSGVRIREISKPDEMIRMTKQSIITNQSSGSFYMWGGTTSWFAEIESPVLWRFDTDGRGGGDWSRETAGSRASGFANIERTHSAAYASTPDAGFIFGGESTSTSSQEPRGDVPGYAYWNLTTGEWNSESSAPYTTEGTLYGGTATYVPTFGPNGIIVVLGGLNSMSTDASNVEYNDFRTVHFIDPVTRRWFSQPTTGGAPSPRHYHCAAGAESTNGTFEIFVYGGANRLQGTNYRDMYILSLPGFVWSQPSNLNSAARSEHSCAVVGRRQLLSWGGIDFNQPEGWRSHDPVPQGLGILDMTNLEWTDDYDAQARPYESPARVRAWYDDGGMDSIAWASPRVERLFSVRQDDDNSNSDNPGDANNQNNDNNSPPPSDDDDDGENASSTPAGAIAGGVVGGVAVLALLAFAAWFYRRRRRQQRTQSAVAQVDKVTELPAAQRTELPAHSNHVVVELDAGGRWT